MAHWIHLGHSFKIEYRRFKITLLLRQSWIILLSGNVLFYFLSVMENLNISFK